MLKLEQITALVLAAGLAIPSYWFFWTMAGGGGYERRTIKEMPLQQNQLMEKKQEI
tara:strand:+ start:399 stop:566 length:168 start_codon:yes stop_codon:yes gene_type:complete